MMFTGSICRQCLNRLIRVSLCNFQNKIAVCNSTQISISRLFSTSISRLRKASKSANTESLLQTRYLYVHTSLGRWADVPDGILLDVGYGDSMPDKAWTPATPTVLALHSSPGSHRSLDPVLQPFVKMGCRVIAPDFPGFGYTEGISKAYSDVFNHSTDEKAEFIRDFLAAFGVKSVDLVIGHGSACYPLLRLATTTETASLFKSAVLMSPWPHREFKGVQPYILHQTISYLWDRPFLRFLCRITSLVARQTLGLKGSSFQDVVTTCRTISSISFDEMAGGLVAADMMAFPIVTVYAGDDPYVSEDLHKEFVDLLGIGNDHVTYVGDDGKVSKPAIVDGFPKCVRFENGGQDLHVLYPRLINAVSWELIKHVCPGVR